MRRFLRAGVAVAALALTVTSIGGFSPDPAGADPGGNSPAAASTGTVRRVLVIAIPAVSWADVNTTRVPHLRALLEQSAIGDLTTRSVRQRTTPGDGYAALGAGARVVAAGAPGQNFQPDEPFGDSTAAEVFGRRTGLTLARGVGALSISSIIDANDELPYDAAVGTLAATLAPAGIGRAVIANADEDEIEPLDARYHREAALAMVDETGRAPAGQVNRQLLMEDPASPFGLRLDRNAVMRAFTKAWTADEKSVVLVEASDLARANAYRALASPEQRAAMRIDALHATDRLVGRLLAKVDPARDAVLVVGPYHSSLRRELTVAALRAPGVEVGYLRTSTTRRTGFVQIVDVAPTIVDLFGLPRPDEMEGRPFEVEPSSASYETRVHSLVRSNRAAVFRDTTIGKATAALVILTLLLAAGALVVFRRRLVGATRALELVALGVLGFLVGTFVAGLFPWYRWNGGLYWGFLLLFAIAYAAICRGFGRRHPADALLLGLGGMVALHLFDALTGARLEFNTVFGYTPTIGIRLAGLGNPGSAQVCASALLFSALLAWRVPDPNGRRLAVAVLAVTVIVVGAPFFGQDFGGAISAAPAYLLLGLLLYGKKITLRSVVLLGVVLVAAGLIVGFVDLARPTDSQTHVGRFFEKVSNDGISGFTTVIGRKLTLMLQTFRNTGWVLLVAGVLGVLIYLVWRTDRLRVLAAKVPTLRAMLISFAVLAVLGTVLNDSGVQVMGMMLAVLVPTLIVLACRELLPDPGEAPGSPELVSADAGTG